MADNYGFKDLRSPAELLLAPKRPVSRQVISPSALKFNGNITGALRSTLGSALSFKKQMQSLSTSLSTVLRQFDPVQQAMMRGTYIPPNPLVQVNVGTLDVGHFFTFSALKPGQPIPTSFKAQVESRKSQIQQLSKSASAIFSGKSLAGVLIQEDSNPTTYPRKDELDAPTFARVSQGGKAAQMDSIIKDKIRFAVRGVQIGAGKPSIWTRVLNQAAAMALPNLNAAVNSVFKDRKNQSTWSEPPTPYAAQYPYNKAQQTESGHLMEFDDTPGAERVHLFHRSGSFVEMHPNGTVVYKNMKDGYDITMNDKFIKVNGNYHIAVDGKCTLYVKGNVDIQSDGDVNINAKKNFNVYASNINLRAKTKFKADGKLLDLRYVQLPGIPVAAFGGLVPRLNLKALNLDYPGAAAKAIAASAAQTARIPIALVGSFTGGASAELKLPSVTTPPETPLSNPRLYMKKTPAAIAYRARMFDTPEEVQDYEMYAGHIELQKTLGDTTDDPRLLGGKLREATTNITEGPKPNVVFLDFDKDFKGKFDWAVNSTLGGTSFTLRELVSNLETE